MNKKQFVLLWAGIIILVLILIIPPWKFTFNFGFNGKIEKAGPYAFIFSPPEIPISKVSDSGNEYFNDQYRKNWTAKIDFERIVLISAAVVIVTAGLIITFKNKN